MNTLRPVNELMDDDGLVKEYQGYYTNQPRLIEKHLPTAPKNKVEEN